MSIYHILGRASIAALRHLCCIKISISALHVCGVFQACQLRCKSLASCIPVLGPPKGKSSNDVLTDDKYDGGTLDVAFRGVCGTWINPGWEFLKQVDTVGCHQLFQVDMHSSLSASFVKMVQGESVRAHSQSKLQVDLLIISLPFASASSILRSSCLCSSSRILCFLFSVAINCKKETIFQKSSLEK